MTLLDFDAVNGLGMEQKRSSFHGVTISIGIATARPTKGDEHEGHLAASDAALYNAKRSGRGRVCVEQWTETPHDQAAPEPALHP
ncbi:GGDEF domain-containing protein [Microvirga sp. CF3016]|uniref:GGDEF domain-containing protein n=1 Tax=Microvirga sp. CF3016 TaxID=3110181 RepID=UPI002E761476|nr:GGDEF domain-containing protein [Microvirga sp. CF3016]MEE1609885.1 GGDEF domain-containing protein [Microvirga sp. CF3016]